MMTKIIVTVNERAIKNPFQNAKSVPSAVAEQCISYLNLVQINRHK